MDALKVTLYVFSALAGLAIGSFLNVCIYRLPRGEFFSRARSYCPRCGAAIKAYDNIPLVSYIVLRGKCRNCGGRISFRYPLVEALTCALFVGNYAAFGTHGLTLVFDVAACALVTASFIDLDTMEIPDSAVLVLLALGLITFAPFGGVSWQDKLIGCACVSVPMFLLALFGGMGLGDVKLYFVLGLLLGWQKVLVVFFVSWCWARWRRWRRRSCAKDAGKRTTTSPTRNTSVSLAARCARKGRLRNRPKKCVSTSYPSDPSSLSRQL